MPTNCITVVENSDGKTLAVIYNSHNGNPIAHTARLQKVIGNLKVVPGCVPTKDQVSSMGALAEELVTKLSKGEGYMCPRDQTDFKVDYIYTIFLEKTDVLQKRVLCHVEDTTQSLSQSGPLKAIC